MKATAGFVGSTVALVAAAAWVLSLFFQGEANQRAILTSACIAVAVQSFAFVLGRLTLRGNGFAIYGVGLLLRFFVLMLYALVVTRVLGLAPSAALFSLATFFFVSTVVEPLFIKL